VLLVLDDNTLRANLAKSLVDDGIAVVTSLDDAPTWVVMVANGHDGWAVVCRGADATASVVPPGPAALVELELAQRIKALALSTRPLVVTLPEPPPPQVAVVVTDTLGDPALSASVVAAVLEARVGLLPAGVGNTVCVNADEAVVRFGLAAPAQDCSALVLSEVPRSDFTAAAIVALLPRRALPPSPPPPPPPPPVVVATAAPEVRIPLSVGVGVGALARPLALDPIVLVELDWWRFREVFAGVDVGPMLQVGLSASRNDTIGTLTILEPMGAVGLAARREIVPGVEVGVGVAAGVWLHSWLLADVDAGITADPFVVVPSSIAWMVQPGVGLALGLEAGTASRTRLHERDGVVGWERAPMFATLSLGLKVDLERAR
jgi:hypothetical protein